MRESEEIKEGLRICTQEDHCDGCPYWEIDFCETYLEKDAFAYIQQLEATQPKWISVKERMPEPYQCVIVHVRHTEKWRNNAKLEEQWHVVEEDCWLGDGWDCNADAEIHEVTHWMQMPEPPKED